MDRSAGMTDSKSQTSAALRHGLREGDAMLDGISPILGHLLSAPDYSLFSDEIVARLRGMLTDIARQVLMVQAEATGQKGCEAFVERHGEPLSEHLKKTPALLAHCHALAIEWQFTQRLEERWGLDPVLSPLLQRLIADTSMSTSSTAMTALAAQARFAQAQKRMELPLGELPGDLLHSTLLAWRDYCGDAGSDTIVRAEKRIRGSYDESEGRLSLFARLAGASDGKAALVLEDAGAGLFFSALAMRSGQSRELAVLSSHARQSTRLAIGLLAAGLEARRIDEILLRIHPGGAPVEGLETLDANSARGILLDAIHQTGIVR